MHSSRPAVLRGLVFLIILSLAAPAGATTLLQTTPQEAYSESSAVLAGTVASKESNWTDGGRNIVTTIVIKVDRAFKGNGIPKSITIVQPGGRMGDLVQRVHGYPNFAPGERALLFLNSSKLGSWSVNGMFQGKYGITRGKDGVDYISPPQPGAGTKIVPLANHGKRAPVPLDEFIRSLKK
jgi:hypothetical protein